MDESVICCFDAIDSGVCQKYFSIPRNGDVVRDIAISALENVAWAKLEVWDLVVWEWVSGQQYIAPPALNLLAMGDHSCGVRVGLVAGCAYEISVRGVFDLYHDIELRRHMASVVRDVHTPWYLVQPIR